MALWDTLCENVRALIDSTAPVDARYDANGTAPRTSLQQRDWPQSPQRERDPTHERLDNQPTSISKWIARLESGTFYPDITREELSIIQDRRYLPSGRYDYPRPDQLLSKNEAYGRLRAFLSGPENDSERHAHNNLERAWSVPANSVTPDLYIKIFNDLDELLFDGQLCNRVLVTWEDLHGDLLGNTSSRSNGNCCPADRIHIQLDRNMFYEESKAKVWGTLVHEMLHAYMFVMTDDASAHPREFGNACRALGRALGLQGLRGDDVIHDEDR
ncbi:hypothetical protein LTR85_011150 [Meristemomyces frigidus]|nr:hypothetical protein LTR85_011150 [Meristemomyces frigidus]